MHIVMHNNEFLSVVITLFFLSNVFIRRFGQKRLPNTQIITTVYNYNYVVSTNILFMCCESKKHHYLNDLKLFRTARGHLTPVEVSAC